MANIIEHIIMTYNYYIIYNGTIMDLLNIGGPHPKERTFEQAYQISFEKYLEQTQIENNIIQGKDPWDALEKLKKYYRLNPNIYPSAVLIISKHRKLICSYQDTNR